MSHRTVLVTDGEQRASLALVRSLGRAGNKVYTCSTRGRSLAGASRYCVDEAAVANALTSPEIFVADIQRLIRDWGVDILLPVTEASLLVLLPERERLAVCVPFADADSVRSISDKAHLLEAAPSVGIAIPQQRVIRDTSEWAALIEQGLCFPVVLKPARSVAYHNGGSVKLAVRHAATRLQLEDEIRALDPAAYPVLVQQRIVGPGVGIFLLLWNGELIATFSHRRLREKPPAGGVSVYRESIAANPALVARSRALLGLFAWRGVAMIEYKLDAATGTPYLMEVNGRFWGSLQLAIDAGVDFPVLLTQAALDERPTPVSHYKTGVRSRWWWGDVDHLMARLRRTDVELSLPPGLPGRLGTLRDFFTLWRPGDRNEVLRFGDPAPFIRETIEWMHRR
ncbi:MAG: ATP-grasp domain-containing protein [Gemmatimonadaceae bacterium]|nr:ATP-grasp domain-containing protein [Gemmatimonadaceae bacterium]